MVTVISIQELLLFTRWTTGPDEWGENSLCGIMGWDPGIIDELTEKELDRFYSQWIALPEHLGRELGVIAEPTHFYLDRITQLLGNGHILPRADFKQPRIIHSTSEFIRQEPTSACHDDDC